MLAAIVVGGFEEQLDKTVLLAFFLPAVVYMADAVGTQTETVLIRGLSVGVQLRNVMKRELATGLIVGVLMGAAFLPFALLVWGDGQVAVAVGLSLVASCSIATLVAMVSPGPSGDLVRTRRSALGRSRRSSRTCCRSPSIC
jgi:magnesium transporter